VFTVDQVTDAPAGFTNSAKITVTTADASVGASQLYIFGQVLEGFNVADLGFGTANAKTVTLSFWVRSSLTGTFGGSLKNDSTYSYPFTYTISAADTWEYKTVTITGQTAGTWSTDNSAGMRLFWSLGAGSTFTTTANAWAAGNYFKPTGATASPESNSKKAAQPRALITGRMVPSWRCVRGITTRVFLHLFLDTAQLQAEEMAQLFFQCQCEMRQLLWKQQELHQTMACTSRVEGLFATQFQILRHQQQFMVDMFDLTVQFRFQLVKVA
jgi:hypothetical protein